MFTLLQYIIEDNKYITNICKLAFEYIYTDYLNKYKP